VIRILPAKVSRRCPYQVTICSNQYEFVSSPASIARHMSRLVCVSCLLLAIASATNLNFYDGYTCNGKAQTTVRMALDTCSCQWGASGNCGQFWQKITKTSSTAQDIYTHQRYSDNTCNIPLDSPLGLGAPVVGKDGICMERSGLGPTSTKFSTLDVPSYMVMECNPTSCDVTINLNSAGTTSTNAFIGLLALLVLNFVSN
jgi:hypothetical protein